jgi:mRNA interferase RelE/StbE
LKVDIKKKALKFIRGLPAKEQGRILMAIHELPKGDVKSMQGESGFRLRVGDWRVVCDITENEITVFDAGSRGDIYK